MSLTGESDPSLAPFFTPHGIAVIGASTDPTKLGYGLARNLIQSRYPGAIHLVNPKGGALLGRPLLPSIAAIPDPVDLAILLIPAPAVPEALTECGRRGIRAVIVASGGFRESGPEGAALEEQCVRIARRYGMRLLGPNCIGVQDTHLPLDTTFLPPPGPLPGEVAFISHSGAICAAVIDWARGQGFGISRLVSLGNQADVSETDVLAPVAADPHTHVLTLYLEGVREGRRFVAEAQRITPHKPIIALKVGRFASGRRAAASHTGALVGEESAFNAAFRRAGVIRAETSEEMFDWARALAWCPLPRGRQVAVLTNAGGPGVAAADALEANNLRLADLSPATQQALRALLPPAASVHNPVDMLASASPEQYAQCLRLLLDDSNVHAVMVILPPPPMYSAGAVAKAITPLIQQAGKPVVVALMGDRLIQEALEHFRAAHVAEYRFPERAASALAVLARRAEHLRRPHTLCLPCNPEAQRRAQMALEAYLRGRPASSEGTTQFLPPAMLAEMMEAYGIPQPPLRLATGEDEAARLAQEMGFPVVLKVASPDLSHKSEVQGVLLNLKDESEVRRGFAQMMTNLRRLQPQARLEGAYLQPYVPDGQEVILGAVQDPQFGALVMFGSGGVEVEGLGDVAFALAPLSEEDAEHLLESTWAGRRLRGFRHLPPADRAAVREILLRFAQFAADFPLLAEVEINPLRVLEVGKGAFALDVRARLVAKEGAPSGENPAP